MLKRRLYITFAFLLVFTTTASIWEQLLSDNQDSVEISFEYETDAEKSESELKDKSENWEGTSEKPSGFNINVNSGFIKSSSSSFEPTSLLPQKLYLVFHRLKIHC